MNEPSSIYAQESKRTVTSRKSIDDVSNFEKQLKKVHSTDLIDHTDVDYYLTNISKILEKHNFNLNSRMFMDNLINTLDQLNNGKKFNRALFTHILDFGNHKKDSVILL
jgi:hypothetical protein